MFSHLNFLISSFSALCSPVPTFLRPVAGIKFEWAHLVDKSVNFSDKTFINVYVLLWIKYRLMWFESLCFHFIQIQKMSQHFWNSGCIPQFLLNLHFSAILDAVCWCMLFLCISSHIDSCAFLYTRWWGERLGQRKRLHHRAGSGPYGAADGKQTKATLSHQQTRRALGRCLLCSYYPL